MNHTPGPWTWFEDRGMKHFVGSDRQGFAHTVGLHEPRDTANARLIASAPALLAALEAVLPLAERYLSKAPTNPDNGKLADARDAIAAARGAK